MLNYICRILLLLGASIAFAQDGHNVLVVINDNSSLSRTIGDYYARRRSIPQSNLCHIRASVEEEIPRSEYIAHIAAPVAACYAPPDSSNRSFTSSPQWGFR